MVIVRDGKEIELTSDELYQAYREQEKLFDIQDVEDNMENYLDEDIYERLKNNQDFIEMAAKELRRNQDRYGMSYDFALEATFRDSVTKFE